MDNNLVKVDVFFEELSYESYTELPDYTVSSLPSMASSC